MQSVNYSKFLGELWDVSGLLSWSPDALRMLEGRQNTSPMKARQDFKPSTKILASLRQEQGRQNSLIPKNERMRQKPFDEVLGAELEWMTQNWKTSFSQPSSFSSSSQKLVATRTSRLSMA